MSIKEKPHVKVSASEFAEWLRGQGEGTWWTVDGDPILGERLGLPCPADDLANEISTIHERLLISLAPGHENLTGQTVDRGQLNDLVMHESDGARLFQCCWEDEQSEWLIIEVKEIDAHGLMKTGTEG